MTEFKDIPTVKSMSRRNWELGDEIAKQAHEIEKLKKRLTKAQNRIREQNKQIRDLVPFKAALITVIKVLREDRENETV